MGAVMPNELASSVRASTCGASKLTELRIAPFVPAALLCSARARLLGVLHCSMRLRLFALGKGAG